MNELSSHNTGAGKGDHSRSEGWRDHYNEIIWPLHEPQGFERVGPGRIRKVYGRLSTGVAMENWDTGEVDTYQGRIGLTTAGETSIAAITRNLAQDGTVANEVPAVPEDIYSRSCCGRCGCGEKHD